MDQENLKLQKATIGVVLFHDSQNPGLNMPSKLEILAKKLQFWC